MISIIPIRCRWWLLPFFMDNVTQSSDLEDLVATGKGEFEFRNTYAMAEVEVLAGVVRKIAFFDESGNPPRGADQICEQLKGKPLSQALEVKAKEVDAFENRGEDTLKLAMLEAFHRAIEACIDAE